MNKTIIILCVVLILINSWFLIFSPEDQLGDIIGGGDDDDSETTSGNNVTVPAIYHGDIANYVNEVFGEMYFINYTSGNWTKITLSMIGTMIISVLNIGSHEDGFAVKHQVVPFSEFFEAKVTLRYQEGNEKDPDADGEDITINGDALISRLDYKDLYNEKIIKSVTDGDVTIDQTLQKLIRLDYEGKLRSYPDPNEPVEKTLDEHIFGDGKSIELNDSGNIDSVIADDGSMGSFYNTVYKWTADKKETISGFSTIRINIEAKFGESEFSLPFLRQIWISSETSQPVKIFTKTNQSAADEDGEFYFILQNTRTLKGFTRGDKSISWGSCTASEHYPKRHPAGEFQAWDYFPKTGSNIDQSSFDFDPSEALSIAFSESQTLKDFFDEHGGDVICYNAQYNSTSDPKIVTQEASNRWLFVFGYKLTPDEWEEYRDNDERPKERYAVQLAYNTTKLGLGDTKELELDYGRLNWSASLAKEDIEDEMLTLTAAERIMKSDSEVYDKVYDVTGNINKDKIYWDDPLGETSFYLGEGITQEQTPSIPVIETLTGFTIPQSKIGWAIQKGRLYSSGTDSSSTFGAMVDAETGRLQYVLEVKGTSLFSLFG